MCNENLFRRQVVLILIFIAGYFDLTTPQGLHQRYHLGANADVDMEFAEVVCQKAEGSFSFQDVFPDAMENIVSGEGKNPFPKDEEDVGLRTVILMAMLCGMNISDPGGKESIELIPFLDKMKKDPGWISGFHGLGALLFSIQDNAVRKNWETIVNVCQGMPHNCC